MNGLAAVERRHRAAEMILSAVRMILIAFGVILARPE